MRAQRDTFPFQTPNDEAAPAKGGGRRNPPAFLKLDIEGSHNQRVVFQEIRVHKRLTRGELAGITGLTKPTIVNVSRQLMQAGLIVETERVTVGRGQPAWVLELNPEGAYAIGLNIDRSHLTMVVLDLSGEVKGRVSADIDFASPDDARAFFSDAWRTLVTRSKIQPGRIVGLGIALPDELGALPFPGKPPSYFAWSQTDIPNLFRPLFPGPIFVENDAVAAAIGEAQFGHGLEAPSFVYILLSVLLGGGIVINRNYFRGARGRSGEIGFMAVRKTDGQLCSLQDVVSLAALSERLKTHGLTIASPDDLERLDAEGRSLVEAWLVEASQYLTDVFAEVRRFIDPDAILLGGRLPKALLDRLAELCKERQQALAPDHWIDVRRATLSSDAPAIGAAILPFQMLLFPSIDALGRF